MMNPFEGAAVAGLGFLLLAAVPSVLMLLALAYVGLRVRDAKSEQPDPELGLKSAYWFLYTLGILTFHFGLTVLFTHWIQTATGPALNQVGGVGGMGGIGRLPADNWSAASRTGWALVLAGALVTGGFYLVGALGTRDREWPSVRRLFTGGRIAVAGMLTVFAFVALVLIQFQREGTTGDAYQPALATLAVWMPSLAIHVFLFRWGGTPPYYVPVEVRRPRPRPRPRRYEEEDEELTSADEVLPPADDATPAEEQPPRRRRPRDDD